MTAAGLSLRGVTVSYGAALALDDFSLEVQEGEVVAVIGPSGGGKSTLLRAIAGLEPLTDGEVFAGGRSLVGVPTHERDLGLMFQDHALFPHLNVADNVAFGLQMKGWSQARCRDRVGELLELVGLGGFGDRPVNELSGGEAQRVALVRALAPEPALLMLDEPFGSLDRVLRDQLTNEVRRLLQELRQTALHVTHDQAEAFALADKVAVLVDGRLEQLGRPAELWHNPSSAFVAEFLGHPNVWSVQVAGDGQLQLGELALGRAAHLGEGSRQVVVPVPALRPDAGGSLEVRVVEAVFGDGRYRVEAELIGGVGGAGGVGGTGVGGAGPAIERVTFLSGERLDQGERVMLVVDLDRVQSLEV